MDESSAWKVGGLRQLDRLALALNEFLSRSNDSNTIPVCVFWADQVPFSQSRKLARIVLSDDVEKFASEMKTGYGQILFFNTHLVVSRGGFAQILDEIETAAAPALLISESEISFIRETNLRVADRMVTMPPDTAGFWKWTYIRERKEIPAAEKRLFLSTAKTQDGVIARWINRPISRVVSRWLVRFPISPNQWTLALMAAPIAGSMLLMRGDYFGAATAAILFQLQSALDGCDGEIARVKYLASEWGHRLDGICDRLATMLLAIGIGVGLSRQSGVSYSAGNFYLIEGILAALLIGVCETLLQRSTIEENLAREESDNPYPNYVRSNQQFFNAGDHLKVWAIKNSGMLFLGERLTSFFVQLTKRDVFNFAFALFIVCGRSRWVLHILAAVACGISFMAMRSLFTMALATQRRPPAASGD